ncbi:MAG: hypothetical protein AAB581_00325 [Patescibacteria group bacterium]
MTRRSLNAALIVLIAAVFAVLAFMGWRAYNSSFAPEGPPLGSVAPHSILQKDFQPMPVVNKGKKSQERDAALEADVRAVSDAVVAYAKDHTGIYPESDIKNPCAGVRYCLKGTDINAKNTIYLSVIPQGKPSGLDYHYRADNQAHTYCVKTASVLETDNTKRFQCTQGGCERVAWQSSCEK